MYADYYFYSEMARIGVVRGGKPATLRERCHSFILDNSIEAIEFRVQVGSHSTEEQPERMRLAIYRDKDCKELSEARWRAEHWEEGGGDRLSVKMSPEAYAKIQEEYDQELLVVAAGMNDRAVCSMDFEYKCTKNVHEDTLTLRLPVSPLDFDPGCVYRIGVQVADRPAFSASGWSWFTCYRLDRPVEELFRPHKASIAVLQRRRNGDSYLQHYRHYSRFCDDVHYDSICEEVMVNPPILSFNIDCPELQGDFRPVFDISLKAKGRTFMNQTAKSFTEDDGTITVYIPLGEWHYTDYSQTLVTATLSVFDHVLATCTFDTTRTERGVCRFGRRGK